MNNNSRQFRISIWESNFGKVYSHECSVSHCQRIIKVSDFEIRQFDCGFMPICSCCAKSIDEPINEETLLNPKSNHTTVWFCCFR